MQTNPTFQEILQEVGEINPQILEIAALRVRNRKLEAALESSEIAEDEAEEAGESE